MDSSRSVPKSGLREASMTDGPITVYVVDDHKMICEGVAALLDMSDDLELVGQSGDGVTALEQIKKLRPDVVVTDDGMPKMHGLDLCRKVTKRIQGIAVLFLVLADDERSVARAFEYGASGYLCKENAYDRLAGAIRAVARGRLYFGPRISKRILDHTRSDGDHPPERLTERERKVLELDALCVRTKRQLADETMEELAQEKKVEDTLPAQTAAGLSAADVGEERSSPSVADRAALDELMAFLAPHRITANVVLHSILFCLSFLLGYTIGFHPSDAGIAWPTGPILTWLLIFLAAKLILFGRMRVFRGSSLYAGLQDARNIVLACFWFLLLMSVLLVFFKHLPAWTGRSPSTMFRSISFGVVVVDFLAGVFLVCGSRMAVRSCCQGFRPIAAEGVIRMLLVGTGDAAEVIIRETHRMNPESRRVIGIVDDDPAMRKAAIHGVPVLGTVPDIPEICTREKIDEITIAMPSATQRQLMRIIQHCMKTRLTFQSLPGVSDLLEGKVTIHCVPDAEEEID